MAKIDERLYFKDGLEQALREHLGKQLRRVFRYSPVKKLAKHLYGKTCEICGSTKDVEIDHDTPVVPVDREIGSLEYFKRMFCINEHGIPTMDNLIGLCVKHHKLKSKGEMGLRAKFKTGPYSDKARAKRKERYRIKLGKKKHVSARRKKAKK